MIVQPATGTAEQAVLRRRAFTAASLGWLLDGFENYAIVLVAAPLVADLVGKNVSQLYVAGLLASTLVAWAIGGLLAGVVADYLGRKRTLVLAILWYSVFTGLSALAPNYGVFIVLRFLTGIGMGAEWGTGTTLLSEYLAPRTRGRGLAFLAGCFGVGFLVATGVWLVIDAAGGSWRWMFVIGILPALLTLYVRRRVAEPQMWEESRQARRDARARQRQGETLDGRDLALTKLTFLHVFTDARFRGQTVKLLLLAASCLIGWWAVSTRVPAFAGVVGAHLPNVEGYSNLAALCYNIGGVLGYFAMGFVADAIGRKPTIFGYFLGSLVVTFVFFLAVHGTGLLLVFAAVNGFFTLGLMGWMGIYPPEVYPTYIRATAITTIFNLTRFIVAALIMLSGYLIALFGSVST
ncbi:MAG: MFS transporter, partial [Streptosporangiales bacterium]|nr:MFS transporter [Streptosporangiales bacterium]